MRLCIDLTEIMGLDCTNPLVRVTAEQWLECYEKWPDHCIGSRALAERVDEPYEPPPPSAPNPYSIDLSRVLNLDADSCEIVVSLDQWNCIYQTHPEYCYGGKSKSVAEREEARALRQERVPKNVQALKSHKIDSEGYVATDADVIFYRTVFQTVMNSEGYAYPAKILEEWAKTRRRVELAATIQHLIDIDDPILTMLLREQPK